MVFGRLLSAAVVSVLMSFAVASDAQAQVDCGRRCRDCGYERTEGYEYNVWGWYNMACEPTPIEKLCWLCPLSVAENGESADAIIDRVRSASSEQLPEVVDAHVNKLLLNSARNMVVVLASGCDPTQQVIESVVFVPAEKAEALERLGVRSLSDFLGEGEAPATTNGH